jgi:hypothetical protein
VQGQIARGVVVLAGGTSRAGSPIPETRSIADSAGIASVRISTPGKWYLKFIRMRPISEADLTHESQWATLTFEVR